MNVRRIVEILFSAEGAEAGANRLDAAGRKVVGSAKDMDKALKQDRDELGRFRTAADRAGDGAQRMARDVDHAGASLNRLKGFAVAAVAVIGTLGILAFAKESVQAYSEAEHAGAQLEAVLTSTGYAAGVSRAQVERLANDMQRFTVIEGDAVVAASSVLLTFTKINSEVFPDAIRLAGDMSVRLGTDLQGAVIQVGKALNDPIKGITALGRAGVSFTAGQKEMVTRLVESGRVLEAQKIILQELQVEFGGSAEAARHTLGGALTALDNMVGDFKEELGRGLAPSLIHIADLFGKWLEQNKNLAYNIGQEVGPVLVKMADLLLFLADNLDVILQAFTAWSMLRIASMLAETVVGIYAAVTATTALEGSVLGLNAAFLTTPLGWIAILLAAATAATYGYIRATNAAHEEELEKTKLTQDAWQAVDELRARTEKLTTAEWARVDAIKATIEAELEREKATLAALQAEKPHTGYVMGDPRQFLAIYGVIESPLDKLNQKIADSQGRARGYEQALAALSKETQRLGVESTNAAGDTGSGVGKLADAIEKARQKIENYLSDLDERMVREQALTEALRESEQAEKDLLLVYAKSDDLKTFGKLQQELVDALKAAGVPTASYIDLLETWFQKAAKLTDQYYDWKHAREQEQAARESARIFQQTFADLDREKSALEAEILVMQQGADARDELAAATAVLQAVEQGLIAPTLASIAAYYEAIKAIQALKKERSSLQAGLDAWDQVGFTPIDAAGNVLFDGQQTKEEIQEVGSVWADMLQVAEGGWEEMWLSVFGISDQSIGDIVENIGRQWAEMLVRLAAQWAAMQLVTKISGGGGGAGGVAGSAVGGLASGAASGGLSTAVTGGAWAGATWGGYLVAGAAFMAFVLAAIELVKHSPLETYAAVAIEDGTAQVTEFTRSYQGKLDQYQALGDAVAQGINDIVDKLDGSLQSLPQIGIGVYGDKIKVWVNGIRQIFDDAQEAVSYAITEALKGANITGLSAEVQAALRNSQASNLEELGHDLDIAHQIETLNDSDVTTAIADLVTRFEELKKEAERLKIPLDNLFTGFGKSVQSLRDDILGIERNPDEELDRRIDDFNDAINQLRMPLEVQLAAAQSQLAAAAMQLEAARLAAESAGIKGVEQRQEYIAAQRAYEAALALVNGLQGQLNALPPPISDDERRDAHNRLRRGGGGGGQRASDRERVEDLLDDFDASKLSDFRQELNDVNEKWDEAAKQAHGNAELLRRIAAARAEEVAQLKAEARERTLANVRSFTSGGGLSSQLLEVQDTADGLIKDLRDLAREGAITRGELHTLADDIRDVAQARKESIIKGATDSLLLDLYGILGDEKAAAQLRYDIQLAELQIRREELRLALEKNGLDMGVIAEIDALIDRVRATDPRNQDDDEDDDDDDEDDERDPPPPPIDYGSGSNGGSLNEAANNAERLDQIIRGWQDLQLSPLERELRDLNEAYAEAIELARATGRSLSEVSDAFAIAVRKFWERALQPLRDFEDSLDFSEFSDLTGAERLIEAQRRLQEAATAARNGDLAAYAQLPDLMRQFLEASRAQNASGDDYQAALAMVRALLAEFREVPPAGAENVALFAPVAPDRSQVPQLPRPVAFPAASEQPSAGAMGNSRELAEVKALLALQLEKTALLEEKLDALLAATTTGSSDIVNALREEPRARRKNGKAA